MEKITITKDNLKAAFELYREAYLNDPQSFDSYDEASQNDADYSERISDMCMKF